MSSPALAAQVPPRADRPRLVTVAFWLFIAATVAALGISAAEIVLVVHGAASHDATALVPGTKTHVVDLIPIAVGVLVVIGVIRAVVLLLLAFVLRKGRSWTRWALAGFALLLLLGLTDAAGLGAVPAVLAIVASVLTFLPTASHWFRSESERRQAARLAYAAS